MPTLVVSSVTSFTVSSTLSLVRLKAFIVEPKLMMAFLQVDEFVLISEVIRACAEVESFATQNCSLNTAYSGELQREESAKGQLGSVLELLHV